jgi:hypothetical protein
VTVLTLALAGRAKAEQRNAKELYKQTLRATGLVWTPAGHGTGWIISRDQHLMITNHHVVLGRGKEVLDEVEVVFPQYRNNKVVAQQDVYMDGSGKPKARPVRGRVLDTDVRRDLAVIRLERVPDGVTELPLAEDSPDPGERLHSVGNPGLSGGMWVYTQGVVRTVVKRRVDYQDQQVEAQVVETTSPINPGDSGGPVVNDDGVLVGVNSGYSLKGQLMSFCIDVSEVKEYLDEVRPLLNPATAEDYCHRGRHYLRKLRVAAAIEDFNTAIKADPNSALAYHGRGQAHNRGKAFDKAAADFKRAIKLDPQFAEAHGSLGWLLATCPKAECRDGAQAVEVARKACELSGWTDANHLDTLAAAFAEVGQLDKAVETETRAVQLATGKKQQAFRLRLESYRQRMGDL